MAVAPDAVLLSPGPGRPETSGIICDAIGAFAAQGTPVFGVCLGHQAIGHVYGADVVGAPELMHGKTSPILHEGAGVFAGLPSPLTATRYHSLTLAPDSIPDDLIVTARSADGVVMGVRHRTLEVEGVQFHPESILTGHGHDLLRTFLVAASTDRARSGDRRRGRRGRRGGRAVVVGGSVVVVVVGGIVVGGGACCGRRRR